MILNAPGAGQRLYLSDGRHTCPCVGLKPAQNVSHNVQNLNLQNCSLSTVYYLPVDNRSFISECVTLCFLPASSSIRLLCFWDNLLLDQRFLSTKRSYRCLTTTDYSESLLGNRIKSQIISWKLWHLTPYREKPFCFC